MRNLGRMCGNRQVKGEGRKNMISLFKETNITGPYFIYLFFCNYHTSYTLQILNYVNFFHAIIQMLYFPAQSIILLHNVKFFCHVI